MSPNTSELSSGHPLRLLSVTVLLLATTPAAALQIDRDPSIVAGIQPGMSQTEFNDALLAKGLIHLPSSLSDPAAPLLAESGDQVGGVHSYASPDGELLVLVEAGAGLEGDEVGFRITALHAFDPAEKGAVEAALGEKHGEEWSCVDPAAGAIIYYDQELQLLADPDCDVTHAPPMVGMDGDLLKRTLDGEGWAYTAVAFFGTHEDGRPFIAEGLQDNRIAAEVQGLALGLVDARTERRRSLARATPTTSAIAEAPGGAAQADRVEKGDGATQAREEPMQGAATAQAEPEAADGIRTYEPSLQPAASGAPGDVRRSDVEEGAVLDGLSTYEEREMISLFGLKLGMRLEEVQPLLEGQGFTFTNIFGDPVERPVMEDLGLGRMMRPGWPKEVNGVAEELGLSPDAADKLLTVELDRAFGVERGILAQRMRAGGMVDQLIVAFATAPWRTGVAPDSPIVRLRLLRDWGHRGAGPETWTEFLAWERENAPWGGCGITKRATETRGMISRTFLSEDLRPLLPNGDPAEVPCSHWDQDIDHRFLLEREWGRNMSNDALRFIDISIEDREIVRDNIRSMLVERMAEEG